MAFALWSTLVMLPPLALFGLREDWIRTLQRPEVGRHWDNFREDMRRQTGLDGPVQRKVPKSIEPPGLVWLRDYFALACFAWLLFGTVLTGMVTLFAWGAVGYDACGGTHTVAVSDRSDAQGQNEPQSG